jgi:hypothetical protein
MDLAIADGGAFPSGGALGECSGNEYGDFCDVSCLPGFYKSSTGGNTYECTADGNWAASTDPLVCSPVQCESFTDFVASSNQQASINSDYTCSGSAAVGTGANGDKCTYGCPDGYYGNRIHGFYECNGATDDQGGWNKVGESLLCRSWKSSANCGRDQEATGGTNLLDAVCTDIVVNITQAVEVVAVKKVVVVEEEEESSAGWIVGILVFLCIIIIIAASIMAGQHAKIKAKHNAAQTENKKNRKLKELDVTLDFFDDDFEDDFTIEDDLMGNSDLKRRRPRGKVNRPNAMVHGSTPTGFPSQHMLGKLAENTVLELDDLHMAANRKGQEVCRVEIMSGDADLIAEVAWIVTEFVTWEVDLNHLNDNWSGSDDENAEGDDPNIVGEFDDIIPPPRGIVAKKGFAESFYACMPDGGANKDQMLGYINAGDQVELLDSNIAKDAYGYRIVKVMMLTGPYKNIEGWTDLKGMDFPFDVLSMDGVPFLRGVGYHINHAAMEAEAAEEDAVILHDGLVFDSEEEKQIYLMLKEQIDDAFQVSRRRVYPHHPPPELTGRVLVVRFRRGWKY